MNTKEFYKLANRFNEFVHEKHDDIFLVKSGSSSVLFSCPHVVEQLRNGLSKIAEPETGILGLLLNNLDNHHLFIKTKFNNDDANYDENCPYKNELVEYVKKQNIKCVIDLHMLAPSREIEINLGTAGYKNISKDKVDCLINILKDNGLNNVCVDNPFGGFYPFTVSSFVKNKCNIDTIQIEINSMLLFEKSGELEKTKIFNIYNSLVSIAQYLEAK